MNTTLYLFASNLPEYENIKFIFDPSEDSLLQQMAEYMNIIVSKAYDLAKSRWKCVYDSFEK